MNVFATIIGGILGPVLNWFIGLVIAAVIKIITLSISAGIPNWLVNVSNDTTTSVGAVLSAASMVTLRDINMIFQKTAFGVMGIMTGFEVIHQALDLRELKLEPFLKIAFKVLIVKMLIDSSFDIMLLIESLFFNILSKADVQSIVNMATRDVVITGLKMAPFLELIYILGILVSMIQVGVVVFLRRMEILVLIVVSPIAFAFLVSDEYREVGKKFIRTFAAVCFQGVVIFMICALYIYTLEIFQEGFTACFSSIGLCIMISKSLAVSRSVIT